MKKETKIALFNGKQIRKTLYNNEWWFSVVDIISVLTKSKKPRDYWYRMKIRVNTEDEFQLSTICRRLRLESKDGKFYKTDCANTKSVFRIIQSIPSPKAEPFKQWLSEVGYERIQEIENPELAQERMKRIYEQKGYSKSWIDKRIKGVAIRQNLTDEWSNRGITSQKDYSILTAEISKATFGMTPSEYKLHKGIIKTSKGNLRDNMTDLELIFTMLGEKVTTEISENEEPIGMHENKSVAKRGGRVAGNARKETENELGRSIISNKKYQIEDAE